MRDILWQLRDVTLHGEGAPPRLEAVSLDVQAGVTAVMGPSGAGKTSLMNLLVGFEEPHVGVVTRMAPGGEGALPVFWAPQGGGLWPHMDVRAHLAAVAPEGADDADELLGELDLADVASARPERLSMGQRSRVSVARALASRARVLVLDEPLAHVDQTGAARYWNVVRNRAAAAGSSLVFSTHSPRCVVGEAERIVCLLAGRVTYAGGVDDLYERPATREQAECLGEANWFEPDEAVRWLGGAAGGPVCMRPERTEILADESGPALVRSERFHGSVAEVDLALVDTGETRRLFHRPRGGRLGEGTRVLVRAMAALLVCIAASGCGGDEAPTLAAQRESYWMIPLDGIRAPAARSIRPGLGGEFVALDTVGRVLVYDGGGALVRSWRMPETENGRPEGVVVMPDGRVVVCDTHYYRVLVFDPEGRVVGRFGREGTGPGEFYYPTAIAQDSSGYLYVCEYGGNDRVQKFTAEGEFVAQFGRAGVGPGEFQRPSGIVWHEGRLYVSDAMNNRVQVFTDSGGFVGILGGDLAPEIRYPYDIALGLDGVLFVIEYGAGRLTKLTTEGVVLGRYGRTGPGVGEFSNPWGLTVAEDARILVADTGNSRIVELTF